MAYTSVMYSSIMKKFNLAGGVKLLGALPAQQVNDLVAECLS